MRAIAIDDFGGPDAMYVAELPVPVPGEGEVRIRMAYAGVNPADWKLREGRLRRFDFFRPSFPLVLGYDGSGVIDAVGPGVSDLRPGHRVMVKSDQSLGRWGTFAEFLVAAADMVGIVPQSMALSDAATIPVAGLTAWHSLFLHGGLKPGQSVFIHAGSGGVGSFAIQFAHHHGARVLASCRPRNACYLCGLGAELTFDYEAVDMIDTIVCHVDAGIDLVVDAVGGETHDLAALLRHGGLYVRIPTLGPGDDRPSEAAIRARGIIPVHAGIVRDQARSALAAIGTLFEAGQPPLPETPVLPTDEGGGGPGAGTRPRENRQ